MERKYLFLKDKYYELLLPTLFMVLSEKICVVIDIMIVGWFIGGSQLSSLNLMSPLLYFTGIFYVLFGQGGSLLALRAKSDLDEEKSNFYFTISIIGIIIISLIYILLLFVFADNILHLLNTPAEIYGQAKSYMFVIMFFYPLNCFLIVISYFIRSDGFPKMPFYSVLIANVINIMCDVILLKGLNMGIEGAALGSVIGYAVGVIYISRYLFSKKRTFNFISIGKIKIKQAIGSVKEFLINTPEVSGKIFFSAQIAILTYLCSTYYGAAGLLAFLVYDNSESFVYIVLSGIMKTMSPIVTVFYKEMDYKAVQYIISKTVKHILMISVPISILFFIYPELLINLFNITNPQHIQVISFAIRITSFGLIGRCMSYLMANYTQAIQQNRVSFTITFFEEFVISVGAGLILTHFMGGIGIWIAILLSETIPVLIYIAFATYFQYSNKNEIRGIFMLQDSHLMNFTYAKGVYSDSKDFSTKIEKIFKGDSSLFLMAMDDICENIFAHDSSLDQIDVTIRLVKDRTVVLFIDDGDLYNPFNNEKFLEYESIKKLKQAGCGFEYTNVLGFNKSYIEFGNIDKVGWIKKRS